MARAPKHCGHNGTCKVLVTPPDKRCPEHRVGWNRSPRTASARTAETAAGKRFKAAVLDRDGHRCQLAYPGICLGTATQADHIREISDGGAPYDATNGQALCTPCHRRKTAKHGAATRWGTKPEPPPQHQPRTL